MQHFIRRYLSTEVINKLFVVYIVIFLFFAIYRIANYGFTAAIAPILLFVIPIAVIIALRNPIWIAYLVIIQNFTNVDFLPSYFDENIHAGNYSILIPFSFFSVVTLHYLVEKRSKIFNPMTKPAFAIILFYVAYFIIGVVINKVDYDETINWFRLNTFFFLNLFLFFFAVTSYQRLRIVLNIILFSSLLVALLNLLEFIGVIQISARLYLGEGLRSSGIFFNANESAYAICIGYLVSYYLEKIQKIKFLFLIRVLLFSGILFTFSRAGLIAYFLITLFQNYYLFSAETLVKKIFISFAVTITLITILYTFTSRYVHLSEKILIHRWSSPDVYYSRENLIKIAIQMIEESPFTGKGANAALRLGSFSTHNYFIHLLVDIGFIGLPFWIYFLVTTYSNIKEIQYTPLRRLLFTFFMVFLLFCLVSNTPTTRPAAVLLGIASIKWNTIPGRQAYTNSHD